jgi:hypothetical protein
VAEEEARAGVVAVGSGLEGVEGVEEEVGLLSSGLDSDGEWWLVVLNGESSGGRRLEQKAERCKEGASEETKWKQRSFDDTHS